MGWKKNEEKKIIDEERTHGNAKKKETRSEKGKDQTGQEKRKMKKKNQKRKEEVKVKLGLLTKPNDSRPKAQVLRSKLNWAFTVHRSAYYWHPPHPNYR